MAEDTFVTVVIQILYRIILIFNIFYYTIFEVHVCPNNREQNYFTELMHLHTVLNHTMCSSGTSGHTVSWDDLFAPDESFVVYATSPVGKIPSANQTLFCSLGHNSRIG